MSDLSKLNRVQIEAALENGGYSDCPLVSVAFVKQTASGQFMYAITFQDYRDEVEDGAVYVWPDEEGKPTADF